MRLLFSLRWRSLGLTMGRREASRRWWLTRFALVREEEDGPLGREGGLGRLRGRGPVERGGMTGWEKISGSRLGRKARWVGWPLGRLGRK
jgi:hypothetical protein